MSDNGHNKEQTEQSSLETPVVSPEVEPKFANIPIGNAGKNVSFNGNVEYHSGVDEVGVVILVQE